MAIPALARLAAAVLTNEDGRRTAGKVRGTVLVPNSDLGEWNDIHPQDKKTLGERTAAAIIKNNKTKTR